VNLSEWREKRKGEKFTLPSGLEVTLRKCDVLDLAAQGDVPTPLLSVVNRLMGETVELTTENAGEFAGAISLVARACLVDPPVADEPDDEHITIDELSIKDRLAIYNWASMGASMLEPFRPEDGEPVGTEARLERVREAAKRDSGS
jgi:hypothetical protein